MTNYFASSPEVEYGWLYYFIGLSIYLSPLREGMTSRLRDSQMLVETCLIRWAALLAFPVFLIWTDWSQHLLEMLLVYPLLVVASLAYSGILLLRNRGGTDKVQATPEPTIDNLETPHRDLYGSDWQDIEARRCAAISKVTKVENEGITPEAMFNHADFMATMSLQSLEERLPAFKRQIQRDGIGNWSFCFSLAFAYTAVHKAPDELPAGELEKFRDEVLRYIPTWDSDGVEGANNLTRFMATSEEVPYHLAIGMWVLWNLAGNRPTRNDEVELAGTLGSFIESHVAVWWNSIVDPRAEENEGTVTETASSHEIRDSDACGPSAPRDADSTIDRLETLLHAFDDYGDETILFLHRIVNKIRGLRLSLEGEECEVDDESLVDSLSDYEDEIANLLTQLEQAFEDLSRSLKMGTATGWETAFSLDVDWEGYDREVTEFFEQVEDEINILREQIDSQLPSADLARIDPPRKRKAHDGKQRSLFDDYFEEPSAGVCVTVRIFEFDGDDEDGETYSVELLNTELREEEWVVGEDVTVDEVVQFRDNDSGQLYATVRSGGEPVLVQRQTWDQLTQRLRQDGTRQRRDQDD